MAAVNGAPGKAGSGTRGQAPAPARRRRQFYQDGVRVPFIAPWSHETMGPLPVVVRQGRGGEGIGYADEDQHPVLERRFGTL